MANELPKYPADHKVGMAVPEGGSNCDKCEYLKGPQRCGEEHFVRWNGSDKIPVKTSRYCCDFFEPGKPKKQESKFFG
jgi:hypothetical protein